MRGACRPGGRLPVLVLDQIPVVGSYSSADGSVPPTIPPPTTNILPLGSRTATWSFRPLVMLPVLDQVSVTGSYRSARLRCASSDEPPATNTRPSAKSVAVC